MLRIQDHFQVTLNLAAKALKVPNLMKDGRWDDEDVFDGHKEEFRPGMAPGVSAARG